MLDIKNYQKIVIKIGSSLLVEQGKLRLDWLQNFASNVAELIQQNHQIVIVTSGAIALGKENLATKKTLSLEEKQAAAAIGQIKLMKEYSKVFAEFDLSVAQILLTAADCNSRTRYLNSQNTIETLLKNKIIPIINENDSVAVEEIKIGDNDRLAARAAQMISADLLILFSDIDGLYDKNPREHKDAKLITEINKITKEIENMAGGSGSSVGTGGMITKIQAAKMAMLTNCKTIITNGIELDALKKLFANQKLFSIFGSEKTSTKSRKKWLSGLINSSGEIIVNECAKEALLNKKISLLAIGIVNAKGNFKKGDAIFIKDESGNHIANGISNYADSEVKQILQKDSKEVKKILGSSAKEEVVHIDNLLVF